MYLQAAQRRRLDDPGLTLDARALLRCEVAKRFEESGNYEGAREAMFSLWQRVGDEPQTEGLKPETAAEVLLRAGTLSGWIASTAQIEQGQEPAKDLLSKSIRAFQALELTLKASEAEIELAYCYWREGNYDEAMVWLDEADRGLGDDNSDLRGLSLLRRSIVFFGKGSFRQAITILETNATLFEDSRSHALKGKFHVSLGSYLKKIGEIENSEEFSDRALLEYAAASYHFEQARHHAYRAGIENQLGFIFAQKGRFADAHNHLNRARRLFVQLRDKVHTAQVDETRGRAFLAERNYVEAEKAARSAVITLDKGGQHSLLAEALSTLGTAQARLGKTTQALLSLRRAADISENSGDLENAARAEILMLEELYLNIDPEELEIIYARADQYLTKSTNTESLSRLRECARKIIISKRSCQTASSSSQSKKKEVRPQDIIKDTERLKTDPNVKVKWDGFSLTETVNELEEALIERALHDAGGSVTKAAGLLGLPNHNSLNSKLKAKGRDLTGSRTPVKPRHRSIISSGHKRKSGH
jgi:tetratricopeptide (TPR) repeat protein